MSLDPSIAFWSFLDEEQMWKVENEYRFKQAEK